MTPQKEQRQCGCGSVTSEGIRFAPAYRGPAREALARGLDHEIDVTCQVAILLSMDKSQAQVLEALGIDKIEYQMCLRRLWAVADQWSPLENS